jgi:hypothetical protein
LLPFLLSPKRLLKSNTKGNLVVDVGLMYLDRFALTFFSFSVYYFAKFLIVMGYRGGDKKRA